MFVSKEGGQAMEARPSEPGIAQLRQTRDHLQAKLKQVNKRLYEDSPAHEDGGLTFALAQRNFIQGNLERVERRLLLARVSSSTNPGAVGIGNVAYIQRGNDIRSIMIIPASDADPDVEYVSSKSPLGKALLGKHVGGSVEISTSLGKQNYGVLRIA
jgi:transcription elongation factor GreA